MKRKSKLLFAYKILLIISLVLILVITVLFLNYSRVNQTKNAVKPLAFPTYQEGQLTSSQQKIIDILRSEYQAQSAGTKYSEGVKEPWCADFVSWVMKEANRPFSNPHSGSWRIPGVYTLEEYFISAGQWQKYGNYQPKVADIVIYRDDSVFDGHTNFVLKNNNGILTTIGGNEVGKIRIQRYQISDKIGIKGYGKIEL